MADLGDWILDGWNALVTHRALVAITLATVAVLYAVAAWIVRRQIPWWIQAVVVPILEALTVVAAVVLLTLQAAGAGAWRAARRRPPALFYVTGNTIVSVIERVRGGLNAAGRMVGKLRYARSIVPTLVMVASLLVWYHRACDEDRHGRVCRSPVSATASSVEGFWTRVERSIRG
jgi:hypothetical protein